jgi:hypothetical protein
MAKATPKEPFGDAEAGLPPIQPPHNAASLATFVIPRRAPAAWLSQPIIKGRLHRLEP